MKLAKLITFSILGILCCLEFIVSVIALILWQFNPPINGSLSISIWMCICIIITMAGMYFALREIIKDRENKK